MKFESPKVVFPEKNPDFTVTEFMADNLAVLYRLTGDTNEVHIDPEVSGGYGYKMPFMQGLCTYGFAARMLIQAAIPYQPERVRHIYAQMRSVCYPGQKLTLLAWNTEPGRIIYKLIDENGSLILGNGIFEYEI